MRAPFALPLTLDDELPRDIRDANGRQYVVMPSALEHRAYIVKAVNYHSRMATAIEKLLAAEQAIYGADLKAGAAAIPDRMDAMRELQQIHKELNP